MKYREFLEFMKKNADNKNLYLDAKKGLESLQKQESGKNPKK